MLLKGVNHNRNRGLDASDALHNRLDGNRFLLLEQERQCRTMSRNNPFDGTGFEFLFDQKVCRLPNPGNLSNNAACIGHKSSFDNFILQTE